MWIYNINYLRIVKTNKKEQTHTERIHLSLSLSDKSQYEFLWRLTKSEQISMESQPFHADSIWYWWIIGNLNRISLLKQVNAIKTAVSRTAKSTTKVLILKWELERIKKIDNRVHTHTLSPAGTYKHILWLCFEYWNWCLARIWWTWGIVKS